MKMLHKFTLGGTSNTAGICRSTDQHMDDIDCVYRAIPLTRYRLSLILNIFVLTHILRVSMNLISKEENLHVHFFDIDVWY
jgi:hypothetical protein